jgi:hypothetical protein
MIIVFWTCPYSGYCGSDVGASDEHIGEASTLQMCWDMGIVLSRDRGDAFVSCELNSGGGCYCSQSCEYMVSISPGSSSVFMNMALPSNLANEGYDLSNCYEGFPPAGSPIYPDLHIDHVPREDKKHTCPAGQGRKDGHGYECFPCEEGHWSNGSYERCEWCEHKVRDDHKGCILLNCPAGTGMDRGDKNHNCKPCESNTFNNGFYKHCKSCDNMYPGYFANHDHSECNSPSLRK